MHLFPRATRVRIDAAINREGQLVDLRHEPQIGVGDIGVGGITEAYISHHALEAHLLFGHYVQYHAYALGVLACPRIGDDLYFLDHRGGNGLEYLLGVVAESVVAAPVLVDEEARAALYLDGSVGIDRHERHSFQHLVELGSGGRRVVGHVVGYAVDLARDQRARSFDHNFLQRATRVADDECPEIGHGFRLGDVEHGAYRRASGR